MLDVLRAGRLDDPELVTARRNLQDLAARILPALFEPPEHLRLPIPSKATEQRHGAANRYTRHSRCPWRRHKRSIASLSACTNATPARLLTMPFEGTTTHQATCPR